MLFTYLILKAAQCANQVGVIVCKPNGFTLVELLIVVVILGILYSVALPAYTEHMQRSRRADVQHVMLQYGASLERIYSRNGGYPDLGEFSVPATPFYTFTYTPSNPISGVSTGTKFTHRAYTLQATPKGASAQASDRCGALIISHNGTHSANSDNCWN